jgi:hypothetical protein
MVCPTAHHQPPPNAPIAPNWAIVASAAATVSVSLTNGRELPLTVCNIRRMWSVSWSCGASATS